MIGGGRSSVKALADVGSEMPPLASNDDHIFRALALQD
jgi:hypothetical protein